MSLIEWDGSALWHHSDAFGECRWLSLQSTTYCGTAVALGIVPTELSVAEQQCVYTDVTRYILWEWINFLLKFALLASGLVWDFSAVFFFSSPSIFSHCCSMCQSSTLHYGLIIAPLASLLSMKGSNRVIAAYYWAIREDDLPLISPLCLVSKIFFGGAKNIYFNVYTVPTHRDRQMFNLFKSIGVSFTPLAWCQSQMPVSKSQSIHHI